MKSHAGSESSGNQNKALSEDDILAFFRFISVYSHVESREVNAVKLLHESYLLYLRNILDTDSDSIAPWKEVKIRMLTGRIEYLSKNNFFAAKEFDCRIVARIVADIKGSAVRKMQLSDDEKISLMDSIERINSEAELKDAYATYRGAVNKATTQRLLSIRNKIDEYLSNNDYEKCLGFMELTCKELFARGYFYIEEMELLKSYMSELDDIFKHKGFEQQNSHPYEMSVFYYNSLRAMKIIPTKYMNNADKEELLLEQISFISGVLKEAKTMERKGYLFSALEVLNLVSMVCDDINYPDKRQTLLKVPPETLRAYNIEDENNHIEKLLSEAVFEDVNMRIRIEKIREENKKFISAIPTTSNIFIENGEYAKCLKYLETMRKKINTRKGLDRAEISYLKEYFGKLKDVFPDMELAQKANNSSYDRLSAEYNALFIMKIIPMKYLSMEEISVIILSQFDFIAKAIDVAKILEEENNIYPAFEVITWAKMEFEEINRHEEIHIKTEELSSRDIEDIGQYLEKLSLFLNDKEKYLRSVIEQVNMPKDTRQNYIPTLFSEGSREPAAKEEIQQSRAQNTRRKK